MKLMKNRSTRFASFAFICLASGLVFSLTAVAQLDPVTLLQQSRGAVTGSKSVQFDMNMVMEFRDGDNEADAVITGSFTLGEGSDAIIHLKSKDQEMIVYNNQRKQNLYFVDQKAFRELPPERNRIQLFKAVLSGPLETPFSWLADFLHGTEYSYEEPPVYDGTEEIEGGVHHVVNMLFPQCSVRAFLTVADPSLLRGFVVELRGATLAKYARTEEASFSVMVDLTNWKLDELLPEDTFVFTPPPGVKYEKEDRSGASDPLKGKEAPDFTLPLLDGGSMNLSQHRDKDIVILDFFASWCGPCRQAMPIVSSVVKQFKDKNVVLYAVNMRETPEKIRAFMKSSNLDMPVLLDKGEVASKYGASSIPHLVIVGKDGIVKTVHGGMSPALEKQLTDDINALL